MKKEMPEIKFNYAGSILHANQASFELIEELKNTNGEVLPGEIMRFLPRFIKTGDYAEFCLHTDDIEIMFTVVPFPEAGFIGMYAHEIKKVNRLMKAS